MKYNHCYCHKSFTISDGLWSKKKQKTPPSLTDFQICGDEKQEFFSWP